MHPSLQGVEKGCIGYEWVNNIFVNSPDFSFSIPSPYSCSAVSKFVQIPHQYVEPYSPHLLTIENHYFSGNVYKIRLITPKNFSKCWCYVDKDHEKIVIIIDSPLMKGLEDQSILTFFAVANSICSDASASNEFLVQLINQPVPSCVRIELYIRTERKIHCEAQTTFEISDLVASYLLGHNQTLRIVEYGRTDGLVNKMKLVFDIPEKLCRNCNGYYLDKLKERIIFRHGIYNSKFEKLLDQAGYFMVGARVYFLCERRTKTTPSKATETMEPG